jgi:hypothetical protein
LSAADVASQLEALISQHAAAGWEFYQLSDVNIEVQPGCLAGLFGANAQYVRFDQIILRTNEEASVRPSVATREELGNGGDQSPPEKITDKPPLPPEPTESLEVNRQMRPGPTANSKLVAVWRPKSDTQIREAVGLLHEYTEESRQVILAEFEWRSLVPATEFERTALEAFRDSRDHQSLQEDELPEHGAARDDEEQDLLAYCYHCGSDVALGSSRCASCGKNL